MKCTYTFIALVFLITTNAFGATKSESSTNYRKTTGTAFVIKRKHGIFTHMVPITSARVINKQHTRTTQAIIHQTLAKYQSITHKEHQTRADFFDFMFHECVKKNLKFRHSTPYEKSKITAAMRKIAYQELQKSGTFPTPSYTMLTEQEINALRKKYGFVPVV